MELMVVKDEVKIVYKIQNAARTAITRNEFKLGIKNGK